MKQVMYSLALGLVSLLAFNHTTQAQTFTNDCLNSDLLVRYYYSTSPCTNQNTGNTQTITAGTSYTFPAPPSGASYYRCEAFIIGATCATNNGAVQLNTGGTCNGPDNDAFGCTTPSVSSVDMWITSPTDFDVYADGN